MDRTDRDPAETIKADTHDALDEAKHRVKAGGEKLNRAVQGDNMPVGDRIVSHVKEAGHEMKADVDKAKRETRDEGI
jgi:hypothetical protein